MRILALAAFTTIVAEEHPIKNVMNMIEDLRKTAKVDQENDDINFEQATHEFNKARESLENSINDERNKEQSQREEAEAQEARVISLTADIRDLETKMGWNKANEDKMVQKRNGENESFEEQKQTLNDIIAAVQECLAELAKGTGLLATGRRLEIQAMASAFMKPKEAAVVGSLLQGGPDGPKARTYDSKTGKVTEIFEKLERDSKDKLNEIKLLEQNSSNDHKLAVAALNGEHKSMDTLAQDKTKQKGAAQAAHDNARKAQNEAKAALADFTQNLRDTTQKYKDDSDRHKLVSKEREDEVEAMGFALDVLQSISGVRADHEELTKGSGPVAGETLNFLQGSMNPKEKIAMILHKAGVKLHNSQLEEIAMRVESTQGKGRDVFKQINNMISKLIDQLVEEQRKEDDHKDWCDRELRKTEAADEDKSTKLAAINTALDKANASKIKNEEDKREASKKIGDLQTQREEEKAFRRKQKANNKVSEDDSKDAQKGIQQALGILSKWAAQRDTSATKTEGNDKVIQMLEEAETHYSQMQADVEGAEQTAQMDHQKSLNNIKRTIATLDAQIVGHDDSLERLSQKLSTLNGKHKHTTDALFEINQYMDDLTPACVKEKGSYEKRRDARTDEREALRNARDTLRKAFDGLDASPKEFVEIKAHSFLR